MRFDLPDSPSMSGEQLNETMEPVEIAESQEDGDVFEDAMDISSGQLSDQVSAFFIWSETKALE